MFGIFIFPTNNKWYKTEHPFRKKSQEALAFDDGAILQLSKDHSSIAAYALHWENDMDDKTFEECFVYFKEKLPSDINISGIKKIKKDILTKTRITTFVSSSITPSGLRIF